MQSEGRGCFQTMPSREKEKEFSQKLLDVNCEL